MWHEYTAYIIIAGAFLYTAYRIYRALNNPAGSGTCATCTEACKLKGIIRPNRKEKEKNCTNKNEKRNK